MNCILFIIHHSAFSISFCSLAHRQSGIVEAQVAMFFNKGKLFGCKRSRRSKAGKKSGGGTEVTELAGLLRLLVQGMGLHNNKGVLLRCGRNKRGGM